MAQRGDVVAVADRGGDYTGKPRPAVIVQANVFDALGSVTICPLTGFEADAPLLRVRLAATTELALDKPSWIQVDKITTVRKARLGPLIGRISDTDLLRLNEALLVFLGLG